MKLRRRTARSSTDSRRSKLRTFPHDPDAIKWVNSETVIEIHEAELAISGGLPGIRDLNVLESAVNAPLNTAEYEQGDLVDLAATYLFHIAKNHGFVDGNKRTAYLTCLAFLRANGIPLGAPTTLEVATLAVAANLIDKPALVGILRQLVILATEDPAYYARVHAVRPN